MNWSWFEKLSARERGLLGLATAAILAALANWLVVQPTLVLLKELDDEIEEKSVLRERNQVMLEDKLLVEEEYRAASARLKMATKSSAEEIEWIKEKVGGLAGQAGVALDSINHREPTPVGHCERYVIEVSRFQARTPDLLRFLDAVSTGEGMLRVSRVSIKPKPKSDMIEGAVAITKVALAARPEEPPAE